MRKIVLTSALLLTSLSGYSQELYMTGLLPDDGQYDQLPCKFTLHKQDYTSLPSSYSLKRYCPEPKSQSHYGTCTGWATAYAARTIAESVRLELTDKNKITDEAFSPLFIYALIKRSGDDNCQYGSQIYNALQLMKQVGVVKYEAFNVPCADNVSQQLKEMAKLYKINDFYTLFNRFSIFSISKVQKVKKAISQDNPVIIGMETPPSFHKAGRVWDGNDDGRHGRHALCVVGYDDSESGGAFLVMNSWGTRWGDNGFTWIKYRDFEKYVYQAYEMYVKKHNLRSIRDLLQITPISTKLSGSIKLRLSNGNTLGSYYNQQQEVYKPSMQLGQNSRYCIDITNDEPSYIYVIGVDNHNKAVRIFPANDHVSAAVTYSNSHISIPSEDSYLPSPNSSDGFKRLCVLFSKDALDFDKVIRDMNAATGSFSQKMGVATSQMIIPKNEISFSSNAININSMSKKSIVPVVIEL